MQQILITGVSSGLGYALAKTYLDAGEQVYAVGRNKPETLADHPHFNFTECDLNDIHAIEVCLKPLVKGKQFDTVILNAGMLGDIQSLEQTPTEKMKEVMQLNVWANKEIIDLLQRHSKVKQVVGISSGAAKNRSKGWGAYSISKAALNALLSTYAKEMTETHFTALAPGVIDTPMVQHILHDVDETAFDSVQRLKNGMIQTPEAAAAKLIATFPTLLSYPSGSFLDIRDGL